MIEQFFDQSSSSFTYLVSSSKHNACIIDPVKENNEIYIEYLDQHQLNLSCILETHTHADHVTGSGALIDMFGCKTFCGMASNNTNIETLHDGQEILLDDLNIQAIYTPGHTDDSYSYLLKSPEQNGVYSLAVAPSLTDNQGNGFALSKLFSSKHPLSALLMELSEETRVR